MLQPGKLRHRVQIERATITRNAFKEQIQTWATHYSCWASIQPVEGTESLVNGQYKAERVLKVVIRYASELSELTVRDRIKFGDRILEISSIKNTDERNAELVMECRERV